MAIIKQTDEELQLYTEQDEYSPETDNRPLRKLVENDIALNESLAIITGELEKEKSISFYHTINSANLSTKRIQLLGVDVHAMEMQAVNGPIQVEGIDYTLVQDLGIFYITWNNRALDGEITIGDQFFIKYRGFYEMG